MATKPAAKRLRSVRPDEQSKPKPVRSLSDAIEHGSYEDVLVWQRKAAVESLSDLGGPALAAMHRQIASLSKEIESVRAAKTEGTDIGEAVATPDADFDSEAL
ncbi:MAG: hypothetical protein ACRDQG_17830 [Pseudonocardiaceae bacterium]